jgi:hypothetical protein
MEQDNAAMITDPPCGRRAPGPAMTRCAGNAPSRALPAPCRRGLGCGAGCTRRRETSCRSITGSARDRKPPPCDHEALDMPDGNRVHRYPLDCAIAFGKGWRGAADAALAAFGLVPPRSLGPTDAPGRTRINSQRCRKPAARNSRACGQRRPAPRHDHAAGVSGVKT